jgi:putative transport protein
VPDFLVDNAILLVFLVMGIGAGVGSIRVKESRSVQPRRCSSASPSASIDDALVRPMACNCSASSASVLFTYTVGLASGPTFVAGNAIVGGALAVARSTAALVASLAALCALVAWALDLSAADRAGLFAGSTTNTPSLQARRRGRDGRRFVVAYSLAYPPRSRR